MISFHCKAIKKDVNDVSGSPTSLAFFHTTYSAVGRDYELACPDAKDMVQSIKSKEQIMTELPKTSESLPRSGTSVFPMEVFSLTNRLRWLRREGQPDELQQAHVGDKGSIDWKPVPVERDT